MQEPQPFQMIECLELALRELEHHSALQNLNVSWSIDLSYGLSDKKPKIKLCFVTKSHYKAEIVEGYDWKETMREAIRRAQRHTAINMLQIEAPQTAPSSDDEIPF